MINTKHMLPCRQSELHVFVALVPQYLAYEYNPSTMARGFSEHPMREESFWF